MDGNGNKTISYKYNCELVTERNDSWLNSHSCAIMDVWRANMDIQLILDPGKVA